MQKPEKPRSKAAQILEELARKYVATEPERVDVRKALAEEIIRRMRPLIRLYLRRATGKDRRCLNLSYEDFVQDASEKILVLLDRHFDPERGAFINLASSCVIRLAWTMVRHTRRRLGQEELVGGRPASDDGDVDHPGWLAKEQHVDPPEYRYGRPFVDIVLEYFDAMRHAADRTVSEVASYCAEALRRGPEQGLPDVRELDRRMPGALRAYHTMRRGIPAYADLMSDI